LDGNAFQPREFDESSSNRRPAITVGDFPHIQLLTIGDTLQGSKVEYPRTGDQTTFKKAWRVKERLPEDLALPLRDEDGELF
jgi:hypothetical protein